MDRQIEIHLNLTEENIASPGIVIDFQRVTKIIDKLQTSEDLSEPLKFSYEDYVLHSQNLSEIVAESEETVEAIKNDLIDDSAVEDCKVVFVRPMGVQYSLYKEDLVVDADFFFSQIKKYYNKKSFETYMPYTFPRPTHNEEVPKIEGFPKKYATVFDTLFAVSFLTLDSKNFLTKLVSEHRKFLIKSLQLYDEVVDSINNRITMVTSSLFERMRSNTHFTKFLHENTKTISKLGNALKGQILLEFNFSYVLTGLQGVEWFKILEFAQLLIECRELDAEEVSLRKAITITISDYLKKVLGQIKNPIKTNFQDIFDVKTVKGKAYFMAIIKTGLTKLLKNRTCWIQNKNRVRVLLENQTKLGEPVIKGKLTVLISNIFDNNNDFESIAYLKDYYILVIKEFYQEYLSGSS